MIGVWKVRFKFEAEAEAEDEVQGQGLAAVVCSDDGGAVSSVLVELVALVGVGVTLMAWEEP